MSEELDQATRYRARAEEVLTIAGDSSDRTITEALRSVAEGYQRMAKTLEMIDATNQSIERLRRSNNLRP